MVTVQRIGGKGKADTPQLEVFSRFVKASAALHIKEYFAGFHPDIATDVASA